MPTPIEIVTDTPQELLPYLSPNLPHVIEAQGERWRIHCHDPHGKSVVYCDSIQAGMRDLVQSLRDSQHAKVVQPARSCVGAIH